MKVKNMPGRKLARQLIAKHGKFCLVEKPELNKLIEQAQQVKTKIYRGVR